MSHKLVVLQAVFLRWKVQFLRNFAIFIWHRNYIFCKEEKPFLHSPCAQGHDRRWIHSATHHITKKKYGRTNEFEVRNHNKQNWYPCLKYIQKNQLAEHLLYDVRRALYLLTRQLWRNQVLWRTWTGCHPQHLRPQKAVYFIYI